MTGIELKCRNIIRFVRLSPDVYTGKHSPLCRTNGSTTGIYGAIPRKQSH
jgi:hypothetical protein